MDRETIVRLDGINRAFYATHAEDFLATRASPWPGWSKLLPHLDTAIRPGQALRILDVGCGNARLGAWLDGRLGRPLRYVGLDRSLSLLRRAAPESGLGAPARALVDLVDSGGELPCRTAACDAVAALALLHHVPSFALRRALVGELVRVVRPGGVLALSLWQFAGDERFERRIVPWSDFNREAESPVELDQLEEGDHLLAWGERGAGRLVARYSHHTSLEEAARLFEGRPASIVETFNADGRSGQLNLYLVLRRT
jgi:SAM-dependent methyltransferase